MKTHNSRINIRVDDELKREAEYIFEKIGLNISDGINIYLRKVVADKGIPFSLKISRTQQTGEEAAEIEASVGQAVGPAAARFDRDTEPGIYRHFKGNRYEVIGVAKHSETMEDMVVYKALYGEGGLWVRPASMWEELVEAGGEKVKRFERVGI
jgi:addiction module RelB/DinJ family antitoxin